MRKILSAMLVMFVLFSSLPPAEKSMAYNTVGAQTYLNARSDNPWSIMALAALGDNSASIDFLASVSGASAIEYAAPILAITARGENPRVFGPSNYVEVLKSYYSEEQIGNPATLNDDFFGILALVSAGESAGDPVIVGSKNFILSRQNGDGGWGFTVTSDSDTNMTAAAILALLSAGVDSQDLHIKDALSFLKSSQNDDGGFPYNLNSASDSSSTAWVIWALNALGVDPAGLVKSDHSPISRLESNQSDQGFFKFQNNSTEDAFSATTTAYAVIALEGKKLPLQIIANDDYIQKFSFRIEGSEEAICSGETEGPTALDIVKNASNDCGFTYEIEDTNWGPYLKRINSDQAEGMTGWLYLVNNISPFVGAGDYQLQTGDSVLWYYGDFDWRPTKLNLSAEEADSGQSVTVKVESFNDGLWSPLAEASVYFGAGAAVTGDDGLAVIAPCDGFYKVYASKQGYIRSDSVLLKVGHPAGSSVDLAATIEKGNAGNEGQDTISFTIDPSSLDFGKLKPGDSAVKSVALNNNGTTDIRAEALVNGDLLFVENLDLNNVSWRNFKADIGKDSKENVDLKLSVPAGYSGEEGAKSAQITFWAVAR